MSSTTSACKHTSLLISQRLQSCVCGHPASGKCCCVEWLCEGMTALLLTLREDDRQEKKKMFTSGFCADKLQEQQQQCVGLPFSISHMSWA